MIYTLSTIRNCTSAYVCYREVLHLMIMTLTTSEVFKTDELNVKSVFKLYSGITCRNRAPLPTSSGLKKA